MGLFSNIGKAAGVLAEPIAGAVGVDLGKVAGGITGKTAARTARGAGAQQASAIMRGMRAQQQQVQPALEALTAGTLQGIEALRPMRQAGVGAIGQIGRLLQQPGAAYTPAAYTPAGYQAPTAAEVSASPAVRFRMQEAQRALETGAAARGGLFGGAHQRELGRYMQGLASQEYEQEAATYLTG